MKIVLASSHHNVKHSNIHVIVAPEKKREKVTEDLLERLRTEFFFNLGKETDIQVQEAPSPKENKSKDVQSKIHYN